MMFTATIKEETKKIAKKFCFMVHEFYLDEKNLSLSHLQQFYLLIKSSSYKEKNERLKDILDTLNFNQVIIFVNTVSYTQVLYQFLKEEQGFPCATIHSELSQEERYSLKITFLEFMYTKSSKILGQGFLSLLTFSQEGQTCSMLIQ